MGYGNYNNRPNYGNNGGGYQRNNYGNQQGGGYQQQQQAPPIDVHQEIVNRFELYNQFKQVALNEMGIAEDVFLIMSPMIGGWVSSIIFKQEKQEKGK